METPEVTVIMPTQGLRPSFRDALRSVLAQDFNRFEVVVVDDSAAGSAWTREPAIAPLLADPRVRVVPFHQGRGCAAAKNAGLKAARGAWACYLDDDNECLPGRIAAQHALASAGSPMVLCGLEIRAGERRRVKQVGENAYAGDALLLRATPDTNVLFHRRSEVAWDEALGTVDDAVFFHTFLRVHSVRSVPNVPRPLVVYRTAAPGRANRGFARHYAGQRRLLVRCAPAYSRGARRILRLRVLLSFCKFRPGGWGRIARLGCKLLRAGGWKEWRVIANVAGSKLPVVRRWMVS